MKKCSNCHREWPDEYQLCPICGCNLEGAVQNGMDDIELLKNKALRGDVVAQCDLGLVYWFGLKGITRYYDEALYWFRMAAERGYARAQYEMGLAYESGRLKCGVNPDAYSFWFNKAAEQGYAEAQYQLGFYLLFNRDTNKAFYWLKKSACQGCLNAQKILGDVYSTLGHLFSVEDEEQAKYWYGIAAEQGYERAIKRLYDIGGECMSKGTTDKKIVDSEYAKLYCELNAKAETGDAEAQFEMGDQYYIGCRFIADDKKAFSWYQKASIQNHAKAQYELGCAFHLGNGVEKNQEEALRWFEKSARNGCVDALCKLGDAYQYGDGVDVDNDIAVRWYIMAARQGNVEAQEQLSDDELREIAERQGYVRM